MKRPIVFSLFRDQSVFMTAVMGLMTFLAVVALGIAMAIGGGVVRDGKILKKYQDFEPGHNLYTYHGKQSEWEDIAAASAINQKYGKLVSEITDREAWDDIVERIVLREDHGFIIASSHGQSGASRF